jgi:hypothetical protein
MYYKTDMIIKNKYKGHWKCSKSGCYRHVNVVGGKWNHYCFNHLRCGLDIGSKGPCQGCLKTFQGEYYKDYDSLKHNWGNMSKTAYDTYDKTSPKYQQTEQTKQSNTNTDMDTDTTNEIAPTDVIIEVTRDSKVLTLTTKYDEKNGVTSEWILDVH